MQNYKIIQQVQKAIERGTGDAYFIIKNNPTTDFSNLIFKAAIRCYGYDVQCEGSRAQYMYNIIHILPQKAAIVTKILNCLRNKKTNDYVLNQLCDLAVLSYKDGNAAAKDTFYQRFEKNILPSFCVCGESQIVDLDAWEGFLKYATMTGRIILKYNENMDSGWRVTNFQQQNPDINVRAALQKISADNPYIAAFLKEITENEAEYTENKAEKEKKSDFDAIQTLIKNDKYTYIPYFKAQSLSQNEIEILANDFLETKSIDKKLIYLCIFSHIKFPFADYKPILKFVKSKNIKNSRSLEFATRAMAHICSAELRAIALQKITTLRNSTEYIVLLEKNYAEGDDKILTSILYRSDNYQYIHNVGCAILDVYTENNTPECKIPLEMMYKKMNCGIHRHTLLTILHQNNVLSDIIYTEMAFDSDSSVRKLHATIRLAKAQ